MIYYIYICASYAISSYMNPVTKNRAFILLNDGTHYQGKAAGYNGTVCCDLVFNTSMTGHYEMMTSPDYFGKALLFTAPHIGNTGIKRELGESDKIHISALLCRDLGEPSVQREGEKSLNDLMIENQVICISDIDTRALTLKIASGKVNSCVISTENFNISELTKILKKSEGKLSSGLWTSVAKNEVAYYGSSDSELRIALIDFGVNKSVVNQWVEKGAYVAVYPVDTDISDIIKFNADGYFISDGPGSPDEWKGTVELIKNIMNTHKPVFGTGLGHLMMAKSANIGHVKIENGHDGTNTPVINLETGKSEITSQSHIFNIKEEDTLAVKDNIKITHRNLNDQTVEGIKWIDQPMFSVQYHPESTPGPLDSEYLFDDFIQLIKQYKNN